MTDHTSHKIRLVMRQVWGKPQRPHIAKTFLKACPDAPAASLTCEICGDSWMVPKAIEHDRQAITCPTCGTLTYYEIEENQQR